MVSTIFMGASIVFCSFATFSFCLGDMNIGFAFLSSAFSSYLCSKIFRNSKEKEQKEQKEQEKEKH